MSTERQKGYSRGYAAGRRKGRSEKPPEMTHRQFWDEAFLKVLPWALDADGWTRPGPGDTKVPIRGQGDRIEYLAGLAADHALAVRKKRFP